MNLSLQNKTALVCGSSQGIGLASAIQLANQGASCILMARNKEALQPALTKLDVSMQQKHSFLVADFDNPDAVAEIVNKHLADFKIDILINNAVGPAAGAMIDATAANLLVAFNRLLVTAHLITQAVVPGMKQRGYGRIINIVSTSVKVPIANLGASNTIRGAVAGWSKTLANELGPYGITVNNVLPGLTKTQRLESLINFNAEKQGKTVTEIESAMVAEIPARRFAEPRELANMVGFLASEAAAYISGTSIRVDGGKTGSI